MDFINEIEVTLGLKAKKNFMPKQAGDVYQTYSSCKKLYKDYGYVPKTNLKEGVRRFINWYKDYYNEII